MNVSLHRWRTWVLPMALLAPIAVGVAASAADRTGSEAIVLTLGMHDGEIEFGGPAAQTFVDALGELSGGGIQVELIPTYGGDGPDGESRVVEAIASGEIDGGWPSTRAFANAGIRGLEAIEAPLTITSFDAQRDLVTSSAADVALEQLDGSGIVGLGLAVLDLRRPFAVEAPLLEPADWEGITFRSYHSPVQDATIRALGGEPVDLSFSWVLEVAAGRLRGAESGVLGGTPPLTDPQLYVTTNVVLWPKVAVLSLSQAWFDTLDDEQREWVTEAAELATLASVDATYDEDAGATAMCEQGVRFVPAEPDQLAALRASVAPVVDALAADDATAPLLSEVLAVARRHPEPDVLDVPADCQQVAVAERETPAIPTETSALPDGIYRTEITEADVLAGHELFGLDTGGGFSGIWTLTVQDGIYDLDCRTLDVPQRDCGGFGTGEYGPFEAGYLRGSGDTVYFVSDAEVLSELSGCLAPASYDPDHCYPIPTYSLTWTLDGDVLTFTDSSNDYGWTFIMTPWQKLG